MTTQQTPNIIDHHDGDEPHCNMSDNPHFQQVFEKHLSRRSMLKGSLGAATLLGFFGGAGYTSFASAGSNRHSALIGFDAISVSAADTVTLPEGYVHQVILPWGEPILAICLRLIR